MLLYLAGRTFGRPALARRPLSWFVKEASVERASRWFERRGIAVIFLSRFRPGFACPRTSPPASCGPDSRPSRSSSPSRASSGPRRWSDRRGRRGSAGSGRKPGALAALAIALVIALLETIHPPAALHPQGPPRASGPLDTPHEVGVLAALDHLPARSSLHRVARGEVQGSLQGDGGQPRDARWRIRGRVEDRDPRRARRAQRGDPGLRPPACLGRP